MDPLYEYRARLVERLETIVPEIADAVAAIPEGEWHIPLAPDERSPHAIVAHLRDTEAQPYLTRLRRMLKEDSTVFEPFDVERWEAGHYDPAEPMTRLLADYAATREAELQLLRNLPPQGWARSGRHMAFGARTVQWWVERMLEHARRHLLELRRT